MDIGAVTHIGKIDVNIHANNMSSYTIIYIYIERERERERKCVVCY